MQAIIIIFILSLVGFFIHLKLSPKPHLKPRVIELFLLYQIVFQLGALSMVAFIGLTFFPELAAAYVGRAPSLFQQELANVNLAFSILGVLSIWIREKFWVAIVIGAFIWLIGDSVNHIVEMIRYHNYSLGKLSMAILSDFLGPVLLIITLFFYMGTLRPPSNSSIEKQ